MKQLDIFDFTESHHGGNENSREAFAASRPTAAEARKRILAFIQSRGAVGATCDEASAALNLPHQTASARCRRLAEKSARKARKQLGVVVRVADVRVYPSTLNSALFEPLLNLNGWRSLMPRVNSFANEHKIPGTIGAVVLPPLIEPDGTRYIGGAATTTCDTDNNFWANAQEYNDRGEKRWALSLTTFDHEMGHLLGAPHDGEDRPYTMTPWAGPYVEMFGRLNFSKRSRRWGYYCFSGQWLRSASDGCELEVVR